MIHLQFASVIRTETKYVLCPSKGNSLSPTRKKCTYTYNLLVVENTYHKRYSFQLDAFLEDSESESITNINCQLESLFTFVNHVSEPFVNHVSIKSHKPIAFFGLVHF